MPFTVLTWYGARRARRPLHELVRFELTGMPTLLTLVGDRFTQESHLRPFRPLAERFGERLHVLLCAEWDERDRLRDGEELFRRLGVAPDLRPRLLRPEGERRCGLFLKQKLPLALVDLYFAERAPPRSAGADDGREPYFLAREELVAQEVERLLARPLPASALEAAQRADEELQEGSALLSQPPRAAGVKVVIVERPGVRAQQAALDNPVAREVPPSRPAPLPAPAAAQRPPPGAHDFGSNIVCRLCGDDRFSVRTCPGKREEGPRKDRFELIEID
jgi:hypothetical protein